MYLLYTNCNLISKGTQEKVSVEQKVKYFCCINVSQDARLHVCICMFYIHIHTYMHVPHTRFACTLTHMNVFNTFRTLYQEQF